MKKEKGNKQKPLTHEMCVKCNLSEVKILLSTIAIAIIILPFLIELDKVLSFMCGTFCITTAMCSVCILVRTLKVRAKLKAGEYIIIKDKVSNKETSEDEHSTTYVLKFKNNKYEKHVSEAIYKKTKPGDEFYLVQLENRKKAIGAFAASDYYVDDSIKNKLSVR